MINSTPNRSLSDEEEDQAVEAIVRAGPRGAIALAGLGTLIVIALWYAFYLVVFLPRVTAP
jgi:hypothetical protein